MAARTKRRTRIHAQVLHPIDTPRLLRDPLYHPSSPIDSTISIMKLVIAAAAIHGAIILVFWVVNDLMGERDGYKPNERVVINIVEKPKPLEEEKPKEEDEGPVLPDFEPKEIEKPEPKKIEKPKPKPKPTEKPKPKPKPTEKPKSDPEPGPVTPDPAPQARRHVGISYESTVPGGKGPALSTGTSRMGETTTTAPDPKVAAKKTAGTSRKSAGSGGGGTREQRTASFIPTEKSVFVKPKRVKPSKPPYPSTLKAQGREGNVQVRVALDAKGKVTKVTILKSSGQKAFDDAALKAAYAESFAPATKDGKGVPFTLSYSYRFRIEEN
jgi:protein TonB